LRRLRLWADANWRAAAYISLMGRFPALRGLRAWNGLPADSLLAIVLAAAAIGVAPASRQALAVALLLSLPLALRRRWPIAVLAVVVGATAWTDASTGSVWVAAIEFAAILVAAYSVVVYVRHPIAAWAATLAAAAALAARGSGWPPLGARTAPFVILGALWLAVSTIRRRQERAEHWQERAQQLERMQELERELVLRDERRRIARELHDVVTHAVSVMTLQTGAARGLVSRDPPRAVAILQAVEEGGREALTELRDLLGLLTADEEAPLAPQPGVADVEALVERLVAAGVPVTLTVEGEARALPAGIDLAGYRIIQEALTNSLRYARGAPACVTIRFAEGALELEVADDGLTEHAPTPGRGLIGMRERAALYGGTVETRVGSAGFTIRARLPLTGST
jgi:signal transduction histidine kinase